MYVGDIATPAQHQCNFIKKKNTHSIPQISHLKLKSHQDLTELFWLVLTYPPHSPDPPPSKKPFSSNPLFKSRNLLKPTITQPTEPPIANPSACKPRDGGCSAVGSGDRSRSWCRCRDPSSLPELWKETIGDGEAGSLILVKDFKGMFNDAWWFLGRVHKKTSY